MTHRPYARTGASVAWRVTRSARLDAFARAGAIVLLVCFSVSLRASIARSGAIGGVTEGYLYGALWLGIAAVGRTRAGDRADVLRGATDLRTAIPIGAIAGGVLLILPLVLHDPSPALRIGQGTAFWPWAAATSLVAVAEEVVLRGVLWRWIAVAGGDVAALIATSALFALIHVPTYGPTIVPLDLAVGCYLGGLRLWFGNPGASAVAHLVADLGTWWL